VTKATTKRCLKQPYATNMMQGNKWQKPATNREGIQIPTGFEETIFTLS
jgi:hypothetical protein